jgi:hypothetical protein
MALAGISTPGAGWIRVRQVTRNYRAEPIGRLEKFNEPS